MYRIINIITSLNNKIIHVRFVIQNIHIYLDLASKYTHFIKQIHSRHLILYYLDLWNKIYEFNKFNTFSGF